MVFIKMGYFKRIFRTAPTIYHWTQSTLVFILMEDAKLWQEKLISLALVLILVERRAVLLPDQVDSFMLFALTKSTLHHLIIVF